MLIIVLFIGLNVVGQTFHSRLNGHPP